MRFVLIGICGLWMSFYPLYAETEIKKEPLTFKFHNAELDSVLKAFTKATGYSLISSERLKGLVTVKIEELDPLKALDLIFRAQKYDYMVDRDNLLIYKRGDTEPRQYTFHLQYVRVVDIQSMVSSMATEDDAIAFSPSLNTISVRGVMSTIRDIQRLLEQVDHPPQQVLIKAKILELKKNDGDTDQHNVLGVDMTYASPTNPNNIAKTLSSGLASAEPSTGLYAQLLGNDVNIYLTAIERNIGYDLLASPWVTAVNHHPSSLLIGSKIGYKTTTTTQTGTQENVQFLEVGIKLVFTPHISDDGYIRLTLEPSISDGHVVNNVPQENTTETFSDVLVKDGQTVVIGGLTKTTETETITGVPFLSRLPWIGALFGRVDVIKEKRDLMILITPTIITPEFLTILEDESHELEGKIME